MYVGSRVVNWITDAFNATSAITIKQHPASFLDGPGWRCYFKKPSTQGIRTHRQVMRESLLHREAVWESRLLQKGPQEDRNPNKQRTEQTSCHGCFDEMFSALLGPHTGELLANAAFEDEFQLYNCSTGRKSWGRKWISAKGQEKEKEEPERKKRNKKINK